MQLLSKHRADIVTHFFVHYLSKLPLFSFSLSKNSLVFEGNCQINLIYVMLPYKIISSSLFVSFIDIVQPIQACLPGCKYFYMFFTFLHFPCFPYFVLLVFFKFLILIPLSFPVYSICFSFSVIPFLFLLSFHEL